MQYTTSEVNHRENLCDLPNAPIIDIGEVYENVIRWWYAILAQHEDGKPLSNDPAATNFSPPGPCLAYVRHVSPSTRRSVRQLLYIQL